MSLASSTMKSVAKFKNEQEAKPSKSRVSQLSYVSKGPTNKSNLQSQ